MPIPGTKHLKYLEENIAEVSVHLDSAQMILLDDALAPGKVSETRDNVWIIATIGR